MRASTVLGVVGAGGIGQELKNCMDLLAFPRLLTIILLILVDGDRHRPRERVAAAEARVAGRRGRLVALAVAG